MQRRTRVRVVTIVVLVALAAAIARFAHPSAAGFIGIRALQRPFATAAVAVGSWATAAARTIRDPHRATVLERELALLRSAHAALQRASLEREGDAAERARTYPERFGAPIAGRIIAAEFEPTSQTVVVAHASADRIRVGDPVLARGALVGIVAASGPTRTIVRLLTDPQSRVGAELATEAGTLGILEADSGGGLVVTRIPNDRTVAVGSAVVTGMITAGIPRGIPVGTVAAVRTDPDGFFQTAALDPMSDPRRELAVTMLAQDAE